MWYFEHLDAEPEPRRRVAKGKTNLPVLERGSAFHGKHGVIQKRGKEMFVYMRGKA